MIKSYLIYHGLEFLQNLTLKWRKVSTLEYWWSHQLFKRKKKNTISYF